MVAKQQFPFPWRFSCAVLFRYPFFPPSVRFFVLRTRTHTQLHKSQRNNEKKKKSANSASAKQKLKAKRFIDATHYHRCALGFIINSNTFSIVLCEHKLLSASLNNCYASKYFVHHFIFDGNRFITYCTDDLQHLLVVSVCSFYFISLPTICCR